MCRECHKPKLQQIQYNPVLPQWAPYQIRKIVGCPCAGNAANQNSNKFNTTQCSHNGPLTRCIKLWVAMCRECRKPKLQQIQYNPVLPQWAPYQMHKIVGCPCAGNAANQNSNKFNTTQCSHNGPLTRYVKLWVAHVPGMPQTKTPINSIQPSAPTMGPLPDT